jgi:hypothetical protein
MKGNSGILAVQPCKCETSEGLIAAETRDKSRTLDRKPGHVRHPRSQLPGTGAVAGHGRTGAVAGHGRSRGTGAVTGHDSGTVYVGVVPLRT